MRETRVKSAQQEAQRPHEAFETASGVKLSVRRGAHGTRAGASLRYTEPAPAPDATFKAGAGFIQHTARVHAAPGGI